MAELDRLRWQCRRGLLELDLIFNRFLEQGIEDLPTGELALFKELLAEADTLLLAWVMGQEQAPPRFQPLIHKLQLQSLK